MNIKKLTLEDEDFPESLRDIPSPPQTLYHAGAPLSGLLKRPRVTIVGSRNVSTYGRQVTLELAGQLAEQGIVIISGLALGIDALAHQAALDAGGLTIAVLPGPLETVIPATNRRLAQAILDKGGALVSEYAADDPPYKQNFVVRNRLMAGLGQVLVVTEAAKASGSRHTVNFALNQGRTVLAVPGNITNPGSAGTNQLLKTGAGPVTSYVDVLHVLGLTERRRPAVAATGRNAHEQSLLDLLLRGISDGEELLQGSNLEVSVFNQALTMLEIDGKIRPLGANHWALY